MNTKTITLTGEETAVKLDRKYPYIWVRNHGDSDVYMSDSPGIVPDADGVVTVPAGGGSCSGDVGQTDTLYFLGSGKIEVNPQFNAVCPFFNPNRKGGDSNAENYINDFLNFSDETNGTAEISGISDLTLPPNFTLECCCMWRNIPNQWGRFIQLVCASGDVIIGTHTSLENLENAVGLEFKIFGEWLGDNGGVGIENIEASKNYTIAVSVKSGSAHFYLDGKLISSANISAASEGAVAKILLKKHAGDVNTSRYIDGKIYSARIYRRALSDGDISHNAAVDKILFGR